MKNDVYPCVLLCIYMGVISLISGLYVNNAVAPFTVEVVMIFGDACYVLNTEERTAHRTRILGASHARRARRFF